MRCLTYAESIEWLAPSGLSISSSRDVLPNVAKTPKAIFAQFPAKVLKLTYLAEALVHWIPADHERMLWLKNWETIPDYEILFFRAARGARDQRDLIDTPGHVFMPQEVSKENLEKDCAIDTAILTGWLLLVMCFDWEAYVLGKNQADRIYISDGHIMFLSASDEDIERGARIFRDFGMRMKVPR